MSYEKQARDFMDKLMPENMGWFCEVFVNQALIAATSRDGALTGKSDPDLDPTLAYLEAPEKIRKLNKRFSNNPNDAPIQPRPTQVRIHITHPQQIFMILHRAWCLM